jgi:DNA-binding LytR/AlgR family response regulator
MSANQKLKCVLVDDEPLALAVLHEYISNMPALEIVQECSNAMEAFEALHKNEVDILFLDINMPVISGLSFLKSLKNPPAVILTTAYTEYAVEGYELDVVDYLVKPISQERFAKAISKVLQRNATVVQTSTLISPEIASSAKPTEPIKDYFFVKASGKLVKINFAEIKYVEGMKDYLKIYTTAQTIVTHQTMKAMEEMLPSSMFMRVHKSYIISLAAIKSIDTTSIFLDMDRVEIPLGSTYKDALMQVVNKISE